MRVVSCTKEKVWDATPGAPATPAASAYTNWRFSAWKRWAEAGEDGWLVLSTQLGLIRPEVLVEGPYDVAVGRRRGDRRFAETLRAQVLALGLTIEDELVVADWERVADVLSEAVDELGIRVTVARVT